jgi:hypothetical protein
LYDDRARAAFQAVQPFVNLEQVHQAGAGLERTFQEEFAWSPLHRLDALWNIDKHRRLTLTAWWPDLFYWMSNGPSQKAATPGDGTMLTDRCTTSKDPTTASLRVAARVQPRPD